MMNIPTISMNQISSRNVNALSPQKKQAGAESDDSVEKKPLDKDDADFARALGGEMAQAMAAPAPRAENSATPEFSVDALLKAADAAREGGKPTTEASEGIAAGAMMATASTNPAFKPATLTIPAGDGMVPGVKGTKTGAQALQGRMAELDPITQKVATGMNTAATITGLRPWSKDWVFQGVDSPAAQNPLIGGTREEVANPEMILKALFGGELAAMSSSNSNDGSAQALTESRDGMKTEVKASPQTELSRGDVNPANVAAFAMLSNLDGEVQSISPNIQQEVKDLKLANGKKAGLQIAGQLSGEEFLSTLDGLRGGTNSAPIPVTEVSQAQTAMQSQVGVKPELSVTGGLGKGRESKSRGFEESTGAASALGAAQSQSVMNSQPGAAKTDAIPTAIINGQVVPGSMAQNRLSSDALQNVTTNIRSMGTQGGGEIRIRLKPENLGELHLKVVTQGNHVGLQIQASDERARKVIEESMSHLKDSLASQNLTLSRVDVTLAAGQASGQFGQNGDSRQDAQYQPLHQGNLSQGMDTNQQGHSGGRFEDALTRNAEGMSRSTGSVPGLPRGMGSFSAGRSSAAAANGRLDVMA